MQETTEIMLHHSVCASESWIILWQVYKGLCWKWRSLCIKQQQKQRNPTKHFNDKQTVWQQQLAKFVDFQCAYETKVIAQNQKPNNPLYVWLNRVDKLCFPKTAPVFALMDPHLIRYYSRNRFLITWQYKFSQMHNTI
jgi:hypothetical protein